MQYTFVGKSSPVGIDVARLIILACYPGNEKAEPGASKFPTLSWSVLGRLCRE